MRSRAALLIILIIVNSCKTTNREILLELVPASHSNISFVNQLIETDESNIIEYLYFNNGAGVAAGDINNDGLADIYFVSNQGPNRLYLNKGNLVFEDITERAGVEGTGDWKTGVTMEDVNGDGHTDIYVCQVAKYKNLEGRNQLFINNGDNTFTESASEYGLDFCGLSTQAAFFDYDLDGDLDMYLLNHSVHTIRSYGSSSLRFDFDSLAGDRLYRNDEVNGKRYFHNATRQSGIHSSQIGYGLGVRISDINNDGFPDIFISNDFHENDYLYINNKDGTFTERLTDYLNSTSRSSMGNDIGDFNNDGLMDILVLDMLPDDQNIRMASGGEDEYEIHEIRRSFGYYYQFTRNTLQLNLGNGAFSEVGRLAGIYSTDWSWSPLFCDLDNDGWKDIFITTGIYRRPNDLEYLNFLTGGNRMNPGRESRAMSDSMLYSRMPLQKDVSFIFRNNRDLTFSNVSREWGIKSESFSNGSAFADLDNDGDQELIVNNINDQAFIYKNNSAEKKANHFLSVKLRGDSLNRRGTGARITLSSGGTIQVAEQYPTRGFASAVPAQIHFGTGKSNLIDSLEIRWPGNRKEVLRNLRSDTTLILDIRNSRVSGFKDDIVKPGQFLEETWLAGLDFKHNEDKYNVMMKELLAPRSVTSEGPALASGDINGDGLDDIFAGGAKGQESVFYIQKEDGSFSRTKIPVLEEEIQADITDAAFTDNDGDGDPDLYIVRGGGELPAGDRNLYDILLINDGGGVFSKKKLAQVSHNGSCVRPCDYDNDNDEDLFVGSGSYPGAYGWPAEQFLLENDGKGNYANITGKSIPALNEGGMVTDAAWTDYDNDGDKDLVLVGEWMSIILLKNEGGLFTDVSADAGFAGTSGWWSSVYPFDINNDGRTDLIAGNVGLNTMLNPSPGAPVVMYLSDFDNNGSLEQVICRSVNGRYFPFATYDELTSQLPALKNRFPMVKGFGGKSVEEIFGRKEIESSVKREAEIFETSLFINRADGTFGLMKMPLQAQFAPVRNIYTDDLDRNGTADIIMTGNDYSVRPTYGRYDASYGAVFLGTGNLQYRYLNPPESGFMVRGDARKIIGIDVKGERYYIVAVNNNSLKVFRKIK